MPSLESTVEIHKNLLNALNVFHSICVKHNVMYSLHGGNLLGAVREHGFIPWDDDVDVVLSRQEYIKFEKAAKEEGLNLVYGETSAPRIVFPVENNERVWIDILIYDFISERKIAQLFKKMILTFMLAFNKDKNALKSTREQKNYTGIKYVVIYFISLLGRLVPYKYKFRFTEKVRQSFCGSKKYVHRANDQYCGIGLILPVSVISNYELCPFEDSQFYITSEYDKVLISTFGEDYMVPKRDKGHMVGKISLIKGKK